MAGEEIKPEEIQKQIIAAVGHKHPHNDAKAKLEEKRLFGDAVRSERYKTCIHYIQIIGAIILGVTAISVIATRMIYLVLPEKWRWLSADQIHDLDHFMFSGTIGGAITYVGQRAGLLGKKEKEEEN